MKVKELLNTDSAFVELNPLHVRNLIGICKLGLHVSLIRFHVGEKPYCTVTSPCDCIDKLFHHVCIFPVRDSMEICTVINRVISIIDYMGYIKHVKK